METEQKIKKIAENLKYFQTHPVEFLETCFELEYEDQEGVKHKGLTEQQRKIVKGIVGLGAKESVASGHGIGKTVTCAGVSLHALLCFPESMIIITAPTQDQLKDAMYKEVYNLVKKCKIIEFVQDIEFQDRKIFLKSSPKNQILFRTASNPEALQGKHEKNLLFIIDEASGVMQAVFDAGRGSLSTKNARILMTSNPTRTDGYFYDSFHKNRDIWTNYNMSGIDSPLVSKEFVEDIKKEEGEDSDQYRIRVLGQFPKSNMMAVIPRELVESRAGKKIHVGSYQFAPKILGVDPSYSETGDSSCIVFRQGLYSDVPFYGKGLDNYELADIVINQYEIRGGIDAVFIDVGYGSGVIDRLQHLGYKNIIPVHFSKGSSDVKYYDKPTEMWFKLREWLEAGGCVPNISGLIQDFSGRTYTTDDFTGKKRMERKKTMKQRGLHSPDYTDAYAVTFFQKVQSSKDVNKYYSGTQIISDYNVLDPYNNN